jgi:hypothetical protein
VRLYDLGALLIEVYVHSFSPDVDYEFFREASQHTYCAPDLARWASDAAFSRFKGRILPSEHLAALAKALEIAKKTNEKLQAHDVSHTTDRMRALRYGIRRTPAVLIGGRKYVGMKEIEAAASQLCGNPVESSQQ